MQPDLEEILEAIREIKNETGINLINYREARAFYTRLYIQEKRRLATYTALEKEYEKKVKK